MKKLIKSYSGVTPKTKLKISINLSTKMLLKDDDCAPVASELPQIKEIIRHINATLKILVTLFLLFNFTKNTLCSKIDYNLIITFKIGKSMSLTTIHRHILTISLLFYEHNCDIICIWLLILGDRNDGF